MRLRAERLALAINCLESLQLAYDVIPHEPRTFVLELSIVESRVTNPDLCYVDGPRRLYFQPSANRAGEQTAAEIRGPASGQAASMAAVAKQARDMT